MGQTTSFGAGTHSPLREVGEQIRHLWWIPFLTGVISIGLGLAILATDWTVHALVIITGLVFVVRGIALAFSPAYAGRTSGEQVVAGVAEAVQKLLGDPARAVEILGAVVNDGVMQRLDAARKLGPIALDTQAIVHPAFPHARIRTPLVIRLDAADREKYLAEWFGPIAFFIATDSTDHSLAIAADAVKEHGALTLSVYSRSQDVIERAIDVAEESGVALSINLTGGVFVNQSAAFSDFHGTGANPAANSALTDSAFVASRLRVVQHRAHV